MILRNIHLVNIGPYRGYNQFNLSTTDEQRVVLIGGENGAGKTSFLNAIKLGIFGAYGFGFKTENTEYFQRVNSLLNSDALRKNEDDFSITIDFSVTEGFKTTDYTLKRKWFVNEFNNLKESLRLTGNQQLYSREQSELFMDRLKETMPPQLLDLCLFDGEEISKIINEDRLSNYIKKVSKVAFNLELFEALENDLDKYSKQTLDSSSLEKHEKELLDLENEITNKQQTLKDLKEEIFKKSEIQRTSLDEYAIKKRTFKNFGGLVKEEHQQALTQLNELEHKKQMNQEQVKKFVASTFPFYLISDLLGKTNEQIQNENSSILYKELDSILDEQKVEEISKKMNVSDSLKLKQVILETIKNEQSVLPLHNASFAESSIIHSMFLKVDSTNDLENHLTYLQQNQELAREIKNIRSKIKQHERHTEFNNMLTELEAISKTNQQIENDLENLNKSLQAITNDLEKLFNQELIIKQNIKSLDKSESSFIHSKKIIELSKQFRTLQMSKKLLHVQNEASKILNLIFRKNNYISTIDIHPETYEVKLKDRNNHLIEKRTLSAGEKEILLISIIWAIFNISGKKVPFIFDTLLGRLDKTHKAALLTEFIPNSGTQSIVLSTDSEIDQANYELLAPFISHAYRLDFDPDLQKTTIKNGYFEFNGDGKHEL